MANPLTTFLIYSKDDCEDVKALKKHLRPLELDGEIEVWYDGEIVPGEVWDEKIKNMLAKADIVLLLISANFFASEYIWDEELPLVFERHDKELSVVIPVIIRSCHWKILRIKNLEALPSNGEAIFDKSERDPNKMLMEVAEGILRVVAKLRTPVSRVFEDINKELSKGVPAPLKKKTTADEILKQFRFASHQLQNCKSTFQNLENAHLPRPEAAQIIQWIDDKLPNDEKGIALIVGDAGTGKSVVLRDVLLMLQEREIPVLGIKADQYCRQDTEKLEKRLDEFSEMVELVVQTGQSVIILIDQIDALSQSLSARREYLDLYLRFVLLLSEMPNVRIVISCRTYDLQNDNDFSFYRRQRHFTLGKLSSEQVLSILKKLSPDVPKLSDDLLILLQTPLHLDLFCQVYRRDLPFEKIKALRDLYEEFWHLKLIMVNSSGEAITNPDKITELVFLLAKEMYDRQNLAVPISLFRAKYQDEIAILESAGIIFKSQEGLVFFHQTFYDFAYAKQFVQSKVKVENYLLENKQNLHIRACLKMMMEFLRERDPKEYLRVMQTILISDQYYFHVKSLLLSLLGFVQKPMDEEFILVRDIVISEPALFKAFVESVKSREWLLFLLESKELEKLVEPPMESIEVERERFIKRVEILSGFLYRHLPESRDEVLRFVNELPDFEQKTWMVQNALHGIKTWDNPLALSLFDAYAHKFIDVFVYEFLEEATDSNLNNLPWAVGHLKTAIEKTIVETKESYRDVEFEYSLARLISHFIKKYPDITFDLLLEYEKQRLLSPADIDKPLAQGAIFSDFLWISADIDNERDSTGLFQLLIDSIRVLAKEQLPRFSSFITYSLESQSATILLVLVEGFRANVAGYPGEIVRFFQIFLERAGADDNSSLAWRARQLLQEAYPYFSELQKLLIIQLVSQIESEYEKQWAAEKDEPRWIGNARFTWLKYLPKKDLARLPDVANEFEELAKRFPEDKDDEPNKVRWYMVGPPLELEEYAKMTLDDWKKSFLKYDDNYRSERRGTNKGGMTEHARQFQEEVKKCPDHFYPLIEELTQTMAFPKTYLVHGLSGLKEAKYSTHKLLSLAKKLNLESFEGWEVISVLGLFGTFADEKIKDDFILDFLIGVASNHPDPADNSLRIQVKDDEIESIFNSGFNTARGYAVSLLPYFYYFAEKEDLIFETLEQIAEKDLLAVRCQMMPRLAMLTNLNKERTLGLFLRLVRDNEAAVMEHSTWTAQYLARQNFKEMKAYFENALAHTRIHKSIGIILSLAWTFGEDAALDLLDTFIERSDEAKAGAIEVAAHNISDDEGKVNPRCIELFERFLGETGEKTIHAYDIAFNDLKPRDFPHIRASLERFARTVIARKNPRPFYEYLISCATTYPEGCLSLAEHFAEYQQPDIRYGGHYDSEPLKVVLNAYHTLWGRKIKDNTTLEFLEKALRIFDRMLLDDRFRRDAEGVLGQVER